MYSAASLESVSLDIASLMSLYQSWRSSLTSPGSLAPDNFSPGNHTQASPEQIVKEVYRRIRASGDEGVWTSLVPESDVFRQARALAKRAIDSLPLYGIPFSVKDNIHAKGLLTTAGCPAFGHYPNDSATVVRKLQEAGAILIGKNTMDQFATGLVGIRSPQHPVNPFNPEFIPGGSSSGSAVAVARGLVSFSLGTDTGGSGRIPAALNNVVGLKPTPGLISTYGLIYANRSFDCVPVFALTCRDAQDVFAILSGWDAQDPFTHPCPTFPNQPTFPTKDFKIAVPAKAFRPFFGDHRAESCFDESIARIESLGGLISEIDFSPFIKAGKMLFDGPLLAERLASIGDFIQTHEDDTDPVVSGIIDKARSYSAVDLVQEFYTLKERQQTVRTLFKDIDALMVPTAGTIYKIDDVRKDPVRLNANMGYYTYFANILRLSAIAVPAAIRDDGLPFGVCFLAAPERDLALLALGKRWQTSTALPLGASLN